MDFKVRYVVWIGAFYFLLGSTICIWFSITLFYYLFCKNFMKKSFFPMLINTIGLVREYNERILDETLIPSKSDSKFKSYLKQNGQFAMSRIWFLYQQDKNKYEKVVNASSRYAFLMIPLLMSQYKKLKKVNRYVSERLN